MEWYEKGVLIFEGILTAEELTTLQFNSTDRYLLRAWDVRGYPMKDAIGNSPKPIYVVDGNMVTNTSRKLYRVYRDAGDSNRYDDYHLLEKSICVVKYREIFDLTKID